MINGRLNKLRELMRESGVDGYIITTSDYHGSEFVGNYFKEREYISGFTGSAGTLVVLLDKAALWTDGRYYIQAAAQLKGSSIVLMKDGTEGVPDIKEYLFTELGSGACIGVDGRTVSAIWAVDLEKRAEKRGISLRFDLDLPDKLWTSRPEIPAEPVWELPIKYTGVTREEKLTLVRKKMKVWESDVFVLTSLDDIAWLLNLRGNDVDCNPVFLSYMIIFYEKAYLYSLKSIFSDDIKKMLAGAGVELRDYNDIYTNLSALAVKNVLIDEARVNYAIIKSIPEDKKIINEINPTTQLKAVKSAAEMKNIKLAHIKDGVAVTRFMYWLKTNIGKTEITEISAAKKLESFRQEQEGYLEPSFEPIFAYGVHGAIVHYSATEDTDAVLKSEGFLLSDTGGQYYEGTTDITRTFALGKLTEEQKMMYTLVLMGNLNLAGARFAYGARGINLDILAREPLWRYGLDFNHGTGHGVGYLLNVHEGPNNIRWRVYSDRVNSAILEEGMVTSDEPGLYLEGKYGIRLENLILSKKGNQTEFGQFMEFETLTMVPFDLDAIELKYMSSRELELLNQYHSQVYNSISPYLEGDELLWLKEATKKVCFQ